MHYVIELGLFVTAIAFVFGVRAAKIFVGACLIFGASFFFYIIFRIANGTI